MALENHVIICSVFCDIFKGFDRLRLLLKIEAYEITWYFLRWPENCRSNRHQIIQNCIWNGEFKVIIILYIAQIHDMYVRCVSFVLRHWSFQVKLYECIRVIFLFQHKSIVTLFPTTSDKRWQTTKKLQERENVYLVKKVSGFYNILQNKSIWCYQNYTENQKYRINLFPSFMNQLWSPTDGMSLQMAGNGEQHIVFPNISLLLLAWLLPC